MSTLLPATPSRESSLHVVLLVLWSLASFGYGLGDRPPTSEELAITRCAPPITEQGRDCAGRPWPLFVEVEDEQWLPPAPVYAAALSMWMGISPRWPVALTSVVAGLLLYAAARQVVASAWVAFAASWLCLATPAWVELSRLGVPAVYPLPFILAWVCALLSSRHRESLWLLAGGGAALGAAAYTQSTAPLTSTILLGVMLTALWQTRRRRLRACLTAAGAFSVMVTPMLFWFAVHPESYRDTLGRWWIHAAHLRNPWDGLLAVTNGTRLADQSSLYWRFFDPAALLMGPPDTKAPAALLVSVALLAGLGLWTLAGSRDRVAQWTIVGGLLATPVAGATFGLAYAIDHAMASIAFFAVLAAMGLQVLCRQGTRENVAAVLLVGVGLLQSLFWWLSAGS